MAEYRCRCCGAELDPEKQLVLRSDVETIQKVGLLLKQIRRLHVILENV